MTQKPFCAGELSACVPLFTRRSEMLPISPSLPVGLRVTRRASSIRYPPAVLLECVSFVVSPRGVLYEEHAAGSGFGWLRNVSRRAESTQPRSDATDALLSGLAKESRN